MKFGFLQKNPFREQGVYFFFEGSNRGFLQLSSLPRTEAKRASPTTLVLPTRGVNPFTEKPDSNRKVSSVLTQCGRYPIDNGQTRSLDSKGVIRTLKPPPPPSQIETT